MPVVPHYHLKIQVNKILLRRHIVPHRTNVPGAFSRHAILRCVIPSHAIPSSADHRLATPRTITSLAIPSRVIPSHVIPSLAIPSRVIPSLKTPSCATVNGQLFGFHILNSFHLG